MKKSNSINGFVVRRPEKNNGRSIDVNKKNVTVIPKKERSVIGEKRPNHDLDYFGNPIEDFDIPVKKTKDKSVIRDLKNKKRSPIKIVFRVVKYVILSAIFLLIFYGGYAAYKFVSAGNNIFQGSVMDIFNKADLKVDDNGRSNILVLGTSEDDPGHEGAMLTDSMLVVSVSDSKKDAFMFSIPRDLYVDFGMACNSGYRGKINEYFLCSNGGDKPEDEQDRLAKTQKFVGDIFGLDIQYGVRVNHTVIKEAVDAVGGVDIDVQGSGGAPGVLDRHADWRCAYKCYYVKYDNGVHHMDGEHALYFASARGSSAPTYGLGNSNFDREVNQQKVVVALKDKALSTGTLTDLNKVVNLFEALGNNLSTNIKMGEIGAFAQLASKIDTNNIVRIGLNEAPNYLVSTGSVGGMSIVKPSAGLYNYTEIRKVIAKHASDNAIIKESAKILILNGTNQSGLAQAESDKLTLLGFNVISIGNSIDKTNASNVIYQIGDGNLNTAQKLSELYEVEITKESPPFSVDNDANFVIVIGNATDKDS